MNHEEWLEKNKKEMFIKRLTEVIREYIPPFTEEQRKEIEILEKVLYKEKHE